MATVKKIKNITDVRNELLEAFENLKARKIDIPTAKAFANLSGKLIKSAATQMEYNKQTGNAKRAIKFLDGE